MSGAVFLAYNPPPSRPVPAIQALSRTSTTLSSSAAPASPEVTDKQRRKSSISALKTIPLPFRSKRKDRTAPPPTHTDEVRVNLFLLLPTELQLQVLQECSFADLCALRATSKEFNRSITGPNSAIARYWIGYRLNSVHRLYPTPQQEQWKYLTSHMHRWNGARHLAEMIAYHIQYKTLLYVHQQSSSPVLSSTILSALLVPGTYAPHAKNWSAQRYPAFRPVAVRIRRRMTPLLFIISHYLSSCQQSLLDSPTLHPESGDGFALEWTSSMEDATRFTPYTRDQLYSTHYCYLFLQWIFHSMLSRPAYVSPVERTMRGWSSTPLEGPTLTQVLVHGNLTAIKQLLRLKDYGERKKWATAFLRSLDPKKNPGWSVVWESLDMRTGTLPTRMLATAILRGPNETDELWVRGAETRLSALGLTLDERELHGNSLTTMRFLKDMAGFDLFHDAPPEDIEDDVESDAESVYDGNEGETVAGSSEEQEHSEVAEAGESGGNYWDT